MSLNIDQVTESFEKEIIAVKSLSQLETLRIKYTGRKNGILKRISNEMPHLTSNQRIGLGTKIRSFRKNIEEKLVQKKNELTRSNNDHIVDLTVTGKKIQTGSIHPLTKIIDQVITIFSNLSFGVSDSPEIDSELYNFEYLNMPFDHPSRDTQQTYYIDPLLLRTHTSNMQVRYMKNNAPPIRVLFPGRAYRRDMPDATHLPSFFQIEGLLVDKTAKMTDLIGVLEYFTKSFFGIKSKIKIYGHHFPYTEPSIEVEVWHPKKGWIEILGAGMVHPKVLKNAGLDPNIYKGWAFGMGPERLAMLKYEIDDIRLLYQNDIDFLNQF